MIAALIGLGGFVVGVAATLLVLGGRQADASVDDGRDESKTAQPAEPAVEEAPIAPTTQAQTGRHLLALVGQALREPLRALRQTGAFSEDAVSQLERLRWQIRMLASGPRPMQAQPTSPISLLQQAADEVEQLRLGKVNASWSLLTRRPVQVDADRARTAFREILTGCARAAGDGGRLAIRVREGSAEGFPVEIEIEGGLRGGDPDPLNFLVARRLLEGQGGRIDMDGPVTRISLRSIGPS